MPKVLEQLVKKQHQNTNANKCSPFIAFDYFDSLIRLLIAYAKCSKQREILFLLQQRRVELCEQIETSQEKILKIFEYHCSLFEL